MARSPGAGHRDARLAGHNYWKFRTCFGPFSAIGGNATAERLPVSCFPARRGKRAGEVKIKVSHARAFRRDLRRALGLERWNAALAKYEPTPGRRATPRERELFEETEFTLPLDFHSWRRAYSQALADADVNVQQATALAGHASLAAHARYLVNSGKMRRVQTAPYRSSR